MRRNDDQHNEHIARMVYRSTPLQNGLSPAEMLMDRQLRTLLPILRSILKSTGSHGESLESKEGLRRSDQQRNFNLRHNADDLGLPTLHPGDPVWIRGQHRQGKVLSRTPEPRSYLVRTDLETVSHNRSALVPTSRESDESNFRFTPPARVSTTSEIATPTAEIQLQTTPARSVSLRAREIPPLPGPATPDEVTRCGRTVKPPMHLD